MDYIEIIERLVNAFGAPTVLLALIVYFLYKKLWKKDNEKETQKSNVIIIDAKELQAMKDGIDDIKTGTIELKKDSEEIKKYSYKIKNDTDAINETTKDSKKKIDDINLSIKIMEAQKG